jgi:hypothetical protein
MAVAAGLSQDVIADLMCLAGLAPVNAYHGFGKRIVDHYAAQLYALGWHPTGESSIFDRKYREQALFATVGLIEDEGRLRRAVNRLAPQLAIDLVPETRPAR